MSGIPGGGFDLFNPPPTAKELRDRALEEVAENAGAFVGLVERQVRTLEEGTQVTGEQIRRLCEKAGIQPHHPGAWGAAVNAMLMSRPPLLFETGKREPMKDPTSHARQTPVYMVKRPPLPSEADPLVRSLMELAEQRWRPETERELLKAAARRIA